MTDEGYKPLNICMALALLAEMKMDNKFTSIKS